MHVRIAIAHTRTVHSPSSSSSSLRCVSNASEIRRESETNEIREKRMSEENEWDGPIGCCCSCWGRQQQLKRKPTTARFGVSRRPPHHLTFPVETVRLSSSLLLLLLLNLHKKELEEWNRPLIIINPSIESNSLHPPSATARIID